MKLTLFFVLLAACLGSAACSRSAADSKRPVAPEPAPAAIYKAGRGLQLSPAALAFAELQTADVAIRDVGTARGVTAVPAAAVLRTAKGEFVFVSNGGWYLRTPVKIGGAAGEWLAVSDGLYEGDTVVTHGVRALWLAEIQAVNGGVGCTEGH